MLFCFFFKLYIAKIEHAGEDLTPHRSAVRLQSKNNPLCPAVPEHVPSPRGQTCHRGAPERPRAPPAGVPGRGHPLFCVPPPPYLGMVMHLVLMFCVVIAFSSSSSWPVFFSFFTRLFTAFSHHFSSCPFCSPFFQPRSRLTMGGVKGRMEDMLALPAKGRQRPAAGSALAPRSAPRRPRRAAGSTKPGPGRRWLGLARRRSARSPRRCLSASGPRHQTLRGVRRLSPAAAAPSSPSCPALCARRGAHSSSFPVCLSCKLPAGRPGPASTPSFPPKHAHSRRRGRAGRRPARRELRSPHTHSPRRRQPPRSGRRPRLPGRNGALPAAAPLPRGVPSVAFSPRALSERRAGRSLRAARREGASPTRAGGPAGSPPAPAAAPGPAHTRRSGGPLAGRLAVRVRAPPGRGLTGL